MARRRAQGSARARAPRERAQWRGARYVGGGVPEELSRQSPASLPPEGAIFFLAIRGRRMGPAALMHASGEPMQHVICGSMRGTLKRNDMRCRVSTGKCAVRPGKKSQNNMTRETSRSKKRENNIRIRSHDKKKNKRISSKDRRSLVELRAILHPSARGRAQHPHPHRGRAQLRVARLSTARPTTPQDLKTLYSTAWSPDMDVAGWTGLTAACILGHRSRTTESRHGGGGAHVQPMPYNIRIENVARNAIFV